MRRDLTLSFVRCAIAWLALFALGSPSVRAAEPTIEDILKVWEARAKKAEHVKLTWKIQIIVPKDSLNNHAMVDGFRGDEAKNHPPSDLTIDGQCEMLLAGQDYRYQRQDSEWSIRLRKLVPRDITSAVQRDQHIDYFALNPTTGHGNAFIHRGERSREILKELGLQPVFLAFRGASPLVASSSLDLSSWEVSNPRAAVEGRRVIELTRRLQKSEQVFHKYLDPEREFQLVRSTRSVKGRLVSQLDVVQHLDATLGWIPKSWRFSIRSASGAIEQSHTATQLEVRVDPTLSTAELLPTLPPRTRIIDTRDTPNTIRIIRDDGSESGSKTLDRVVTSEELLQVPPAPNGSLRIAVIILVAIVTMLVVSYLVVRITRQRRLSGR